MEAHIHELNHEIEQLKSVVSTIISSPEPTEPHKSTASLHILTIQQLYRTILHLNKATHTETSKIKQEMNTKYLFLQNHNFVTSHLIQEIEKAMNIETVYQTIPLISEQEYLGVSMDGNTGSQLMVNRLQYELSTRKKLEEEEKELLRLKKKMMEDDAKQRAELNQIDREIEEYLQASVALQKKLGIYVEKEVVVDGETSADVVMEDVPEKDVNSHDK